MSRNLSSQDVHLSHQSDSTRWEICIQNITHPMVTNTGNELKQIHIGLIWQVWQALFARFGLVGSFWFGLVWEARFGKFGLLYLVWQVSFGRLVFTYLHIAHQNSMHIFIFECFHILHNCIVHILHILHICRFAYFANSAPCMFCILSNICINISLCIQSRVKGQIIQFSTKW